MAFRARFKRWPKDVPELERFALQSGRPLDLSGFAKLAFLQRLPETILVTYETNKPSHQAGGFTVSVFEVRPRQQRNSSGAWYYCANPAGYYPTVQTCTMPWQTVPASAPTPNQLWYYCANPAGYYPHVQSCSAQWQGVPAH
jgi:hypothetical protein